MKKILFVALILVVSFSCQIVSADPPDATEVDEIKLRAPLELERAVMEYMLAFEAYTAARRSKNPKVRSRLVPLMQNYRNSYARFLEMLREDKIYRPNKPKDPAGWYDEKHKKDKGHKLDWKKTDAKEIRKEVKEMVRNGASPEEVKAFIQAKLPSSQMSSAPFTTSLTTSTTSSASTGVKPGSDDDDDDDDDGDDDDDDTDEGGKDDDKDDDGWWPGKLLGFPKPGE